MTKGNNNISSVESQNNTCSDKNSDSHYSGNSDSRNKKLTKYE